MILLATFFNIRKTNCTVLSTFKSFQQCTKMNEILCGYITMLVYDFSAYRFEVIEKIIRKFNISASAAVVQSRIQNLCSSKVMWHSKTFVYVSRFLFSFCCYCCFFCVCLKFQSKTNPITVYTNLSSEHYVESSKWI